jgi:hypothetical protein
VRVLALIHFVAASGRDFFHARRCSLTNTKQYLGEVVVDTGSSISSSDKYSTDRYPRGYLSPLSISASPCKQQALFPTYSSSIEHANTASTTQQCRR